MPRGSCPLVHRTFNHPLSSSLRNISAAAVAVRLFPMVSMDMVDETDIVVVEVIDGIVEISLVAKVL